MLKWTSASLSDQGVKRADNQDNLYISDDKRVFVVADGMGGAQGGSIAARLTVNAIENFWKASPADLDDQDDVDSWLVAAVNKANETVFGFSEENPSVKGMGTTVVVGVQDNKGYMHIGHLGDSRAYLVRNGSYEILTQDHSLVMELYRGGHITEEQMKESPFKHYITRCVGHKDRVELERNPKRLEGGDWLLMCTDGLTAVLQDDQIASIVSEAETPEEACKNLVQTTLDGGAPDNVTVVVVKYADDEKEEEEEKED
jgi:PPM family protein phosphatase